MLKDVAVFDKSQCAPKSTSSQMQKRQDSSGRFLTYLVPYLPVTPTFFVRFVILADAVMNDAESEV
jgi:hypothetical protein